jgi:transcription elongation GreA/GreB family factor
MITKLGKQKLEEHLTKLQDELKKTCEARGVAAEGGDLKENSAYIYLGEKALVLYSQIDQVKADIRESKVQSAPTQNKIVEFGSKLKIKFNSDGREMDIILVGKNDAHLKPEWISCDSPLGIALIGKHKSDQVSVNDQPVTILDISIGEI